VIALPSSPAPDAPAPAASLGGAPVAGAERRRQENIPFLCGFAALVMACIALAPLLLPVGWNTSILIHAPAGSVVFLAGRQSNPDFLGVATNSAYDGVAYYAIARDPLGRGPLPATINLMAYRYEHPGYPWLALLLSTGEIPWLPDTMVWLNLGLFVLSAYLFSLLAAQTGRSPWWGLLPVLNPGLLVALAFDTTEIALAAAMLLGLLLWLRGSRFAPLAIAAACFAKELGWALPIGLGLYETARFARAWYAGQADWRRGLPAAGPAAGLLRRLALLMIGPALCSLWYGYVDIVIAPRTVGRFYLAPPSLLHALMAIPIRLLLVAGVWSLPLLAALAVAALRSRLAARRARLASRALLLLLPGVALLLVAIAWQAGRTGSLVDRIGSAQTAGQIVVGALAARAGVEYYNLAPLTGIARTMLHGAAVSLAPATEPASLSMWIVPAVLATGGLFVLALVASLRLRSAPQGVSLILALPMLSLSPVFLEYPEDLLRVIAVPALFAALALMARSQSGVAAEPAAAVVLPVPVD